MKKAISCALVVLIAGVFCAAPLFAGGTTEEKPQVFKVGFLSSLSGPLASFAEPQRKSFILAAEEINAKGGLKMPWGKVPVETFIGDDEAKLDVGVRRFREMVEKGVLAVTGGIFNPMSGALNEECKVNPIIYVPGFVPAFDAFKKGNPSDCTFTPTFTPWSIGYITVQAIVQTLGKKTIYYVERADSWGTTIRQGMEDGCKKFGAQIIGVDSVSIGTNDYSAIITKAMAAKPDVFVTSMTGSDGIANLKQASDMGLYEKCIVFNSWTAMSIAKGVPDQAMNHYALVWFYWDLSGLGNQDIVKRVKAYSDSYIKRWNEAPDNMGTACYVATQLIFGAVQKAGTFDPKAVAQVLASEKFDTVKGPLQFRVDHQPVTEHVAFLLRGKPAAKRTSPEDYFEVLGSYGGEATLPPLSLMGY